MTKKRKLITATGISAVAIGMALAGTSFAATSQGRHGNDTDRPQMTDEQRTKMQEERETEITTAFDTAETSGKITAEQKAKLLELHAGIKAKMQSGDREGGETLIKEMHDWMTSNNIDASVMPKPNGKHGQGMGGKRHAHGQPQSTTDTNTSTTE